MPNRAERRRNARLGLAPEELTADRVTVERKHLEATIATVDSMTEMLVEMSAGAPDDIRESIKKLQSDVGTLTGVLGLSLL